MQKHSLYFDFFALTKALAALSTEPTTAETHLLREAMEPCPTARARPNVIQRDSESSITTYGDWKP